MKQFWKIYILIFLLITTFSFAQVEEKNCDTNQKKNEACFAFVECAGDVRVGKDGSPVCIPFSYCIGNNCTLTDDGGLQIHSDCMVLFCCEAQAVSCGPGDFPSDQEGCGVTLFCTKDDEAIPMSARKCAFTTPGARGCLKCQAVVECRKGTILKLCVSGTPNFGIASTLATEVEPSGASCTMTVTRIDLGCSLPDYCSCISGCGSGASGASCRRGCGMRNPDCRRNDCPK